MKKVIPIIISAMLLVMQTVTITNASWYPDYDTEPFSGEEYSEYLERVQSIELVNEPITNYAFESFAISEKGKIALVFYGDPAQIDIYDSEGTFLYGYRFPNAASIAIFFSGEHLSIYRCKKDHIVTLDRNGNCVYFQKVLVTAKSNKAFMEDRYRPSSGEIHGIQYTADHLLLSPNYSRFTVKNGAGQAIVIYDATQNLTMRYGSTLGMVVVLASFVLFVRHRHLKACAEESKSSDTTDE